MDQEVQSRYYRQEEFLMSSNKKIFIEIEVLKLLTDKPEFPQGYKFKWLAFNRDDPDERVLFDNHEDKGPHYHENSHQEFFAWISRKHTQQMFYQKIIQKFGSFQQKLS